MPSENGGSAFLEVGSLGVDMRSIVALQATSPALALVENFLDGAGLGQMEALDVVDANLLEHR
jgi:hypothetical protein